MAEEATNKPARRTERIGKYEILDHIATGGMGIVYKARDVDLDRLVALKILPPDLAKNQTTLIRFKREAAAAAQLRHENIVAIYDIGEHHGTYFLALEYIEGTDLQDYINRQCKLDPKDARKIMIQAARALAHAHDQHVVHRDIKPSNFLLTYKDKKLVVKLTDFGLAIRQEDDAEFRLTREKSTVGTVDYMSPEQATDSRSVDIRSDIYSLGCTFFHMMAGTAPFAKGTLPERIVQHMQSPPPDLRQLNKHVPKSFAAIINRMLEKKPADRYQTPTELLKDLENPDRVARPSKKSPNLQRDAQRSAGETTAVIERKEIAESVVELEPLPMVKTKKKRETDEAIRVQIEPAAPTKFRAETDEVEKPKFEKARKRAPAGSSLWMYGVAGTVGVLGLVLIVAIVGGSRPQPTKKKPEPPPVVTRPQPVEDPGPEAIDTAAAKMVVVAPELPRMDPSGATADGAALRNEFLGQVRTFPAVPKEAKILRVSRLATSGPPSFRSLADALAQAQPDQWTVIEIADNGPIFIPALAPLSNRSVVLRGAAGFQPLLAWEFPKKDPAGKPARTLLSLTQGTLILENLDIVMKAAHDAPSVLFELPDTDFYARECTFSLMGRPQHAITLVRRQEQANPALKSRTWLKRCYLRGPDLTLLALQAASTDLVLEDSLVVGQRQSLIQMRGRDEDSLGLCCIRSTLVTGQSLVYWQPLKDKSGMPDIQARILDSILSRDDPSVSGDLIHLADETTLTRIRWRAVNSVYAGWKGLLASSGRNIPGHDLDAWHRQWGYSSGDRAVVDCWPSSPPSALEEQSAATFLPYSPLLGYEAVTGVGAVGCVIGLLPGEPEAWIERIYDPRPGPTIPAVILADVAPPPIAITTDGLYNGELLDLNKVDLGKHLASVLQKMKPAPRVVMRLFGRGNCATSPVRVKGVDNLVLYFVATANPKDTLTLEINPAGLPQRAPLIEMTGGHLELIGARIHLNPFTLVPTMVQVQDGQLSLTRCWLEGPLARTVDSGRALISVSNTTDAPALVTLRDSVLVSTRPLIHLRDAVQLKARNNVFLSFADGVQIDGDNAPGPTTHVLEHNTWAVRHAVLTLRPGADLQELGAVRVYANSNAFLRPFTEEADKSVLLRGAESWVAQGRWIWQGRYNVYDTRQMAFFASGDKQQGLGKQTLKDWQAAWGQAGERDSLLFEAAPSSKVMTLDTALQLDRLALPAQLRGDPSQMPPGANLVGLGLKKKG